MVLCSGNARMKAAFHAPFVARFIAKSMRPSPVSWVVGGQSAGDAISTTGTTTLPMMLR
jgi:hypothetical protein